MSKSKPTMRAVAQAAGVSATTVWMVVNQRPGISTDTANTVWAAIDELGYQAKPAAISTEVASVGLLIEQTTIPAISDVFYGGVIRGFQAEAKNLGLHVVLSTFDRQVENFDVLNSFSQEIQGFVVANDGDITAEMIMQMKGWDTPMVLIESYIAGQNIPCVLGDHFMAGYMITRHLLDIGHRKIALLKGPTKYSSLVDRLRGCFAALAEEGLLCPPEWQPDPVRGHPLKGFVQMQEILALPELPTAVVAISDKTATGAMEAIREAGLSIPSDMAIVSMDNTEVSQYSRPPLTTIHIPNYEIGVLAMQKLYRLIQGLETTPVKSLVYSELIVRESCGASNNPDK